jgi:hypothetical protein
MFTRLVATLARNPGGLTAWAVAVLTLGLPAALLGYSVPRLVWVGDTMPVVPTVAQQYRHGTRDLAPYLNPPRRGRWAAFDPRDPDPHCVRPGANGTGTYSNYPAGMELFAWPAVLVAALRGEDLSDDGVLLGIERQAAAAAGGLCVALFFLVALRIGPPPAAWLTAAFLATGSVVFSTLTQLLWQQTGVAIGVLVLLLVELRPRVTWRGTAVQAVACAVMVACRPSAAMVLVPFWLWVVTRDWRRGLVLPLAALLAYAPWAATYWALYRALLGPSMTMLGHAWTPAANVPGVLVSPGRGLFVYQPWLLLVVLLVWKRVRTDAERPLPRGWYAFVLGATACHVALVGSWGMWWGGYCWGSRLAAEIVPVFGLLTVRPVAHLLKRWSGRSLLVLVALAGLAVHLPYTHGPAMLWNADHAIDNHPEHLWDWRNPPFLYTLPK